MNEVSVPRERLRGLSLTQIKVFDQIHEAGSEGVLLNSQYRHLIHHLQVCGLIDARPTERKNSQGKHQMWYHCTSKVQSPGAVEL
jgi:hypothetical protein